MHKNERKAEHENKIHLKPPLLLTIKKAKCIKNFQDEY